MKNMAAIIKTDYYLPKNILTNKHLADEFPEWNATRIEEKVGIKQRHIVSPGQTATDLAYEACEKVLEGFDRKQVDFLLLCTQSPDYYLPTSACLLQERLGLATCIGAFDYNLGCSGYIYGLAIAKGLISAGLAKNILLVTAETYSKQLHPKDKGNRSIFGDGAGASIISSSENNKILEFELGTDGKGRDNLITENGAFRNMNNPQAPDVIDAEGNLRNPNCLYMNGPEIFNFTLDIIPSLINKTLEKNKLALENIDFFIFHQANKFILDYLRKKLNIPKEKFYINMTETGNTVSATIPIALKQCLDNSIVKEGMKVILAGFGVGYSWGAVVIEI
jgi:3-oxoacyl-[acyl-carrier-protein] synthase III